MSYGASRDRRGWSGGYGGKDAGVDVEALERENDLGIDGLSDRVGLLKQAADSIRSEANSHHSILDNMDTGMMSNKGMLGGAFARFGKVMNDKQNSKMATIVTVTVVVLLLTWYLIQR